MRRILLILAIFVTMPTVWAQVVGLEPTPLAMYTWNATAGEWQMVDNSSTANASANTPQAVAFYGYNVSLGQWTPCTTLAACFGGGGSGTITGAGVPKYVPLWTGSGGSSTSLGDSHLDDGYTTPGTITSTEPFVAPAVNNCQTPGVSTGTTVGDTNLIQGAISAAGNGGCVSLTPGQTYLISQVTNSNLNFNFYFNGAWFQCMGTGDCLVQSSISYTNVNVTYWGPNFEPGNASTGAAFHDTGSIGTTVWHPFFRQIPSSGHTNASYYFYYGEQIDSDELFVNYGWQLLNAVLRCDSVFCGDGVYGTDNGNAVGYFHDMNMSMGCGGSSTCGNGIDWESGNDFRGDNIIVQAFSEFGFRNNSSPQLDRFHCEEGGTPNPALNNIHAQSCIIQNGDGNLKVHASSFAFGNPPVFPVTGTSGSDAWTYWIIATSALYGDTAPMSFGQVTAAPIPWTSATTASLTFPTILATTGDTITCTILRTRIALGPNAPYPFDGVADVVATGQACGGPASYWTYSDNTPTSSLTTHTFAVRTDVGYTPTIQNWSGDVIFGYGPGADGPTTDNPTSFTGDCYPGMTFVTTFNYGYTVVPQVGCTGNTFLYPPYAWNPVQYAEIGSYGAPPSNYVSSSAVSLQTGAKFFGAGSPIKGPINLGYGGIQDMLQLYDSNPWKTLATPGNRPPSDLSDLALGQAATGYLGGRAPSGICFSVDMFFTTYTPYQECMNTTKKWWLLPTYAPTSTAQYIFAAGILAPSAAPAGAPSTAGGTVAASIYNRAQIVSVDSAGNVSLPTLASSNVVTTGSTSSIQWSWYPAVGAVSYQIWVCAGSGCTPAYYYTSSTNTYTQTSPAASGNSGTLPAAATSYGELEGSLVSTGPTFAITSGCTTSARSGGAMAGKFVASSSTCSPVITPGITAPNGFACWVTDLTTSNATIRETATSTTTVTFTGASLGSTDAFTFGCVGY